MSVASGIATLVDWLVFATLMRLVHVDLPHSAAFAAAAGALVHFSLCRSFVFSRFSSKFVVAAPRYVLVSAIALLLHTTITTALSHFILTDAAWAISKISVFALWIYPASRYLVFGETARTT